MFGMIVGNSKEKATSEKPIINIQFLRMKDLGRKQDIVELSVALLTLVVLGIHQLICAARGTSLDVKNIVFVACLLSLLLALCFYHMNKRKRIRLQFILVISVTFAAVFVASLIIRMPGLYLKVGVKGLYITLPLFVLLQVIVAIIISIAIKKEKVRTKE